MHCAPSSPRFLLLSPSDCAQLIDSGRSLENARSSFVHPRPLFLPFPALQFVRLHRCQLIQMALFPSTVVEGKALRRDFLTCIFGTSKLYWTLILQLALSAFCLASVSATCTQHLAFIYSLPPSLSVSLSFSLQCTCNWNCTCTIALVGQSNLRGAGSTFWEVAKWDEVTNKCSAAVC